MRASPERFYKMGQISSNICREACYTSLQILFSSNVIVSLKEYLSLNLMALYYWAR